MYFLGLSALGHDTAAALLTENGFVAAIEESKLARSRSTTGIPRLAMDFCLRRAGISWHDVTAVAVASRPQRSWIRRTAFRTRTLATAPISSAYYLSKATGELAVDLNNLRVIRSLSEHSPQLTFDHHLCHAASAFYASGFDRSLILTFDEQGDGLAGSVALGEAGHIRIVRETAFPHSLAWIYSQITELLGYRPHEQEHKTQWLSLTAEPKYLDILLAMIRRSGGVYPKLDSRYFTRGFSGRLAFSQHFYACLGIAQPAAQLSDEVRASLASSIQKACEIVVTEIAQSFRKKYALENLCLAGGLFLNTLLVSEIEKNAGFANVFVQPASGNEGASLGAAWLAKRNMKGSFSPRALASLYLGPQFTSEEIKNVLDNCKASYRWMPSDQHAIDETVKLLNTGRIVGWFQGAAEFGPRALGNRSLLASPWAPYVKENLNDYVKHREAFRPFALSVLEEDASTYFETPTAAAQFMATLGTLRARHRELLGMHAVPQDRVRLHVVKRQTNPFFWSLLKAFGSQAPAPILLNASFNLFGEPLVVSPRDAVRSYFCSGVDALVIGSFLLVKA
jgi:carbamoyltransferase